MHTVDRSYLVLLQPQQAVPKARAPWGDAAAAPTSAVLVSASSIADAVRRAESARPGLRAVSIEEKSAGLAFSDDRITAALTSVVDEKYSAFPRMDPADYVGDQPVYDSVAFLDTVRTVADALRDSDLIAGLNLSLNDTGEGPDYAMVEMYVGDNHYRATGADLKNLTDDRSATGWDGVLAIARALIALAETVA